MVLAFIKPITLSPTNLRKGKLVKALHKTKYG
jgi:hypothetical protein